MAKSFKPERNYLVHPSYILLTLLLAGITSLFLSFCGSYMYNRLQQGLQPVSLPVLFYINTLFLLSSSFCLIYAKKAYENDDTEQYKNALLATLFFTIVFLVAQYFAWQQLISNHIRINHSTLASYLYIISGVHFAHVLIGIPFLVSFIYTSHTKMKHPISVLLYFSDLEKKRNLILLNIYWHYLDILWLCLVLFFLINLIL